MNLDQTGAHGISNKGDLLKIVCYEERGRKKRHNLKEHTTNIIFFNYSNVLHRKQTKLSAFNSSVDALEHTS